MLTIFNHEKLKVYQRALAFCTNMETFSKGWDSKHAIANHLPRAAESIVENLAEASAAYSALKQSALEYSMGSALECAGCLDISYVKGLSDRQHALQYKEEFAQIFKMLFGLHKSWGSGEIRENGIPYQTEEYLDYGVILFNHEQLDVYRLAIQVMRWFSSIAIENQIPAARFRTLDTAATSMILNIAEGNGRFSQTDHRRFLEIAHRAAIKMASQLDICACNSIFRPEMVSVGKTILHKVTKITAVMIERD